jgi:hypothetical protein
MYAKPSQIMEIKNCVNTLLAEENILAVKDNFLKWRMASCIQLYYNPITYSARLTCILTVIAKKTKTIESRVRSSANATAAETQAAVSRPF